MKKPLSMLDKTYKEELDLIPVCECEECKKYDGIPEMKISGDCHPGVNPITTYDRSVGCIKIRCGVCEKPIMMVAVAELTTSTHLHN